MTDPSPLARQSWLRAQETQDVFDALGDDGAVRFVGGCVRNALLGEEVRDIDVATKLVPDVVIERLEAAGLKAVPTGIDHGTVTAVSGGRPFEITTLRKDVETHGRHATIAYSTDWSEDAARRDFTMNALYASREGEILDPLGGISDLKARRVRFIGKASERIAEDYLRILRFFRIHAWYGEGSLDEEGLRASAAAKDHLTRLSVERVRDEVMKLLGAPNPVPVLHQMVASGVLGKVLPGRFNLERLERLCAQDAENDFKPDPALRFGGLLELEPDDMAMLAYELRLSKQVQARLRALKGREPKIVSSLSVREVRKALYQIGAQAFQDRCRLAWAENSDDMSAVGWQTLIAMADAWRRPDFPLTGADVMKAGAPSGPKVGRILGEMEDWWVDNDFVDDPTLLAERLKAVVEKSQS